MQFVFLLISVSALSAVEASRLKGKPVPGAIILDQVLSRFLNQSDYTDAIFDYLRGNDNARRRSNNLDVDVLDRENVQKIINSIKTRYETENHRRYIKAEAYYEETESTAIKETALDMMKQSIYASKYRINDTRRFRKFFADNPSYHIAMYYGALMQISIKLETLYTIIKKMYDYSHFLWYLVIYEKILAANVDAHDMVDRIFDLHAKHLRRMKGEKVELVPTIPTTTDRTSRRPRRRRTRTRPSTLSTLSRSPGSVEENGTDVSNATATTDGDADADANADADATPDTDDKKKGGGNSEEDGPPANLDTYDEQKRRPRYLKRDGRLINMERLFTAFPI